jgi:hypothetical protein
VRVGMDTIRAMAWQPIAEHRFTSPRRPCITARRSMFPPRHVLLFQFLLLHPLFVFRSTGLIVTITTTGMVGAAKRWGGQTCTLRAREFARRCNESPATAQAAG